MKHDEVIQYLEKRFDAQTELFTIKTTHLMAETRLLIDGTNDRLDTIVKQNEVRNHRIENNEMELKKVSDAVGEKEKDILGKITGVEKKVDARDLICTKVQEGKSNHVLNNRWVFMAAMALLGFLFTALNFINRAQSAPEKVPVELFYSKNDSVLYIPKIYFRSGDSLREVSVQYYNISKHGRY